MSGTSEYMRKYRADQHAKLHKGVIYAVRHPYEPDNIKIGKTTKKGLATRIRCHQGILTAPVELVATVEVSFSSLAEKLAHRRVWRHLIPDFYQREVFKITTEQALEALLRLDTMTYKQMQAELDT